MHSGTLQRIEQAWEVNLCTCKPSPIDLLNFGRDDLAELFGTLGFTTGAEVGVERGHFSKVLLESNQTLHLTCVDAWTAYQGYREHVSQDKLDAFLQETKDRLAPFSTTIIKGFSTEVASTIPDNSLDFVFLDANHTFEQVSADIEAWAPKVRSGGIVSGHDYVRRKRMNYGVKEAIQGFTHKNIIKPWMVVRLDKSPSWFYVKP